jgi:hypothetical protein
MQLGRLLAASLHQAVADELPQRLDFYEHWLHSEGLRDGTIGMAPISAVVGFLRAEGEPYGRVVARAGTLAADWWVASLPASRRRLIGWLPRSLRVRAALRVAGEIARAINTESEVSRRVRKSSVEWRLTSSVFCSVRSAQAFPLCGFYVALLVQTLGHFGLAASGRTERCKAVDGPACVLALDIREAGTAASPPAMAA